MGGIAKMGSEEVAPCVAPASLLEQGAVVAVGLQGADGGSIEGGIESAVRGERGELPGTPCEGGGGSGIEVALTCAAMGFDSARLSR